MLINLDFNYRLTLSHLIANYDPILQQTNNDYYRCRVFSYGSVYIYIYCILCILYMMLSKTPSTYMSSKAGETIGTTFKKHIKIDYGYFCSSQRLLFITAENLY